ncbi:MAG: hypothetical protein J0L93_08415 [Deltaproteobacteria bacterium]|nr:hypothetical protein [Deltaproteobacteria bacterium]
MKVTLWGTLAVLIAGGSFQTLSAHDVKPGEPIQNYVTHAEIDQAVQTTLDQKRSEEAKVQQELAQKRQDELRQERFFNRSSRER